jgi:hypothetical protein
MKALLILTAVLAGLCARETRAEWVSYQRSADVDELYDTRIVSRDGALVKLWTMTNFARPMTTLEGRDYQSEKMLTTIDCARRKTGAETVVRLSGRNAAGDEVSTMASPLRLVAIRTGSSDDALFDRICR